MPAGSQQVVESELLGDAGLGMSYCMQLLESIEDHFEGTGRLGLRSDADVFAYYAKTRFDILFRHYARGFWHIIQVLCRNFLTVRIS